MTAKQKEEDSPKSFSFLAPNGVGTMGKKSKIIRLRLEDWDKSEAFLRKPCWVTLKKVEMPAGV